MSEIENLKIGNGGTLHIVGNEDIIANEWEAGQVYIENRSYVIREHKLLMCNTTHTSVEPFDPDKWTEKNIGEALGTAGSANMIECTLAEYNAWKAGGQLINETVYVITDAPNLNATAQDISYEGSTDTVWDKVEGKQDKITVVTTVSGSTDNTGNMVVPDISPATHMLLSAYKVRSSPNTDIAMASIGINGSQTAYLVHLALTDGTAYASKSNVVLKIAYIEL